MSEKEKAIAEKLGQAFAALPDEKKEYLIGYAEGVAAMAERQQEVIETLPVGVSA